MEFRSVNNDNYFQCLELRVAPGQEGFVPSNQQAMAEAFLMPDLHPRAIYHDEAMVGFLMFGYDYSIPGWSLNQLMIDAQYQGRGLGRSALEAFLSYFQKSTKADCIHASIFTENAAARKLFSSLGFAEGETHSYACNGHEYHEIRMVKTF